MIQNVVDSVWTMIEIEPEEIFLCGKSCGEAGQVAGGENGRW